MPYSPQMFNTYDRIIIVTHVTVKTYRRLEKVSIHLECSSWNISGGGREGRCKARPLHCHSLPLFVLSLVGVGGWGVGLWCCGLLWVGVVGGVDVVGGGFCGRYWGYAEPAI